MSVMIDIVTLIKNEEWEKAMIIGDRTYYGDINNESTWEELLERDKFDWQIMDSLNWSSLALLIHENNHIDYRHNQIKQLKKIISNSFEINEDFFRK